MDKRLKDGIEKNKFWQGLIAFLIMMEAALFERFFIPHEIRIAYYGYISILNTVIHLVIFYPLLNYLLFCKRK